MPLSRDSRTEKKLKALRRAEFRLKQQFEYIDWQEDHLFPEIEALKAGRPVLGLEAGAMFDLQVAHAYSDHDTHQSVRTTDPGVRAKGGRRNTARKSPRLRLRKQAS